MSVLTKEVVMMNYFFNVLTFYDIDNDNEFIERLKNELEDDAIKNIINSSDEKTRNLFSEPFSVNAIKDSIRKANEEFLKYPKKIRRI